MEEHNMTVSVVVLTYNHEKYIRQALDSILMQEVDFEYEILVGEDCSPDKTRLVLEEYQKKYPDKFTMLYREVNIGARRNLLDLYGKARGEYIAQLEGDDFWVTKNKLQKQVEFLRAHKDFIATAHRTKVVNEFSEEIVNIEYPECKETLYTLKKYKHGILPGQSASILMRNFLKENIFDLRLMNRISRSMPGDRVLMFLLASYGKIYCFQEIMSAYRYVTENGTSFSARQKNNRIDTVFKRIEYYKQIMEYSKEFIDNNEAIKTIESIYLWQTVLGFFKNNKNINLWQIKNASSNIKNKKDSWCFVIYRLLSLPKRRLDRKKGIIGR